MMIKTHHAVDFRAGKIERLRDLRNGLARHIAKGILNAMKNWQQGAGQMLSFFENAADNRVPVLPLFRHNASSDSGLTCPGSSPSWTDSYA